MLAQRGRREAVRRKRARRRTPSRWSTGTGRSPGCPPPEDAAQADILSEASDSGQRAPARSPGGRGSEWLALALSS